MTAAPQPVVPADTVGEALGAALSEIDRWPVQTAAAAVAGPTGLIAGHGPIGHAFELASVTKPLAALAILLAVEEGAVTLEQAADATLLPGATLRHLLAHASGVAPEHPIRLFGPAQRRVYSNVGIERAAALVEEAAEIPFAEYLHEAVCEPLGLTATTLVGSPAKDGRSSVTDLARVIAGVLAPPAGWLSGDTLADLRTVQYPGLRGVLPGYGGQDPNDWGLGFEIRGHKSPHWTGVANSPETFGHFGQAGTMFWIEPRLGIGLVALADRAFGSWAAQAWPALSDAVLAAYAAG